jgi:putative aminopeptidase FrvX
MQLLRDLCAIPAPTGSEGPLTAFLLEYVQRTSPNWQAQPMILAGPGWQDCVVLIFGEKPRTAVFAHLDSIGYTVRYGHELIPIGGPAGRPGDELVGHDARGPIRCRLRFDEDGEPRYDALRELARGTTLTYAPHFRETDDYIQSPYLDNRLGVWVALRLAETMTDGVLVFGTYEEHGGGAVSFIADYLWRTYGLRQALIADITWVTEGVGAGQGAAISLRDRFIPRRAFIDRVISIAEGSQVPFQLEVEGAGGSDGAELQRAAAPWDWCFVGAPETDAHTPDEKVMKVDIDSMLALYRALIAGL